MSERKVLNKYYPPDFDPTKIPRVKCPKNRQFTVRLMAPFNMRCKTCGEYIYKGKKFNARKEDVEGDEYLGIRIFRFYIKCTRCLQEISFKTDPRNMDYEIEAGATRNFMALKLAEEQAEREEEERREEEASNPMKVLENRTKQSKHELELLESLEELKDMNRRQQSIDYNGLLAQFSTKEAKERLLKMQEEEDEKFVQSVFGQKRIVEEEVVDTESSSNRKKMKSHSEPSVVPEQPSSSNDSSVSNTSKPKQNNVWNKSIGGLSKTNKLNSLVRIKRPEDNPTKSDIKSEPSLDSEVSSTVNEPSNSTKQASSALTLLGSYSGSESNDSD